MAVYIAQLPRATAPSGLIGTPRLRRGTSHDSSKVEASVFVLLHCNFFSSLWSGFDIAPNVVYFMSGGCGQSMDHDHVGTVVMAI